MRKIYKNFITKKEAEILNEEKEKKTLLVKNVVIDNYYFGVAAISKDGIESPVVFPGDVGSFDHNIK